MKKEEKKKEQKMTCKEKKRKKEKKKTIRNPDQRKPHLIHDPENAEITEKQPRSPSLLCAKTKSQKKPETKRKEPLRNANKFHRDETLFTTPEKRLPWWPCRTSWAEGSGGCWARHHPGRW
jgi:hypothetical protein